MTDWLNATTDDRKALYRTTRRVCAVAKIRVDDLVVTVCRLAAVGHDYESNFRKGLISCTRANDIQKWIAVHHPAFAAQLEAELENGRRGMDHNRYIVVRSENYKIISFGDDDSISEPEFDRLKNLYRAKSDSARVSHSIGRKAFND